MSEIGVEDVGAEQARVDLEHAKKSKRDATMASVALDEAKRKFDQDGGGEPTPAFAQNGQVA